MISANKHDSSQKETSKRIGIDVTFIMDRKSYPDSAKIALKFENGKKCTWWLFYPAIKLIYISHFEAKIISLRKTRVVYRYLLPEVNCKMKNHWKVAHIHSICGNRMPKIQHQWFNGAPNVFQTFPKSKYKSSKCTNMWQSNVNWRKWYGCGARKMDEEKSIHSQYEWAINMKQQLLNSLRIIPFELREFIARICEFYSPLIDTFFFF